MTFVDVKPVSSELEQRDDPTPEVACEEPFDLARLLSEQIKGKMIMRTFQARGELAAEERRQLADLILTAEIGGDPNKMIPPDRFAELARQVAQVFPTESSRLYYSKSDQVATIDGKTRKKARGILYDKFTHLRRKFRAKGLIDQPYGRTSSSSSSPSTSTASKGKKILEGDERSEWLQSHLQPWEQVVEYWRMTYEHRASNLKLPETNILEYFNKYPALKQPAGCNLLLQDFNVKYNRYPQLHRNLLESWPIHREKIIALLERKCRTERAFKSLISSHGLDLENIADPFDRDVLAFKSLGFLLPCAIGPRDKSSKKSSRYSKTQASDALLLRIPNPAQLPATVAARNECLQNFGLAGNPWGVEFRQLGVRILSARLHGLLSKLQNARHSDAAQEIRVREIGSVRVQKAVFTEEDCGSFLNKSQSSQIRRIRDKSRIPCYNCETCGVLDERRLELMYLNKMYVYRDRRDLPFKCDYCPKSYSRRQLLTRHQKFECHQIAEKPRFQCPYCPHSAKRKDHLKVHVMNQHQTIPK
ncbi:unnamed protein product [Bemisia tabaci]|uniref:C2H2-type domain-containing protein n=1 Tax=Bemisia tabaci TaxID=7038 RepID=A0A9N9ZZU4_BEMTA|nr:unnamed protein product [Bemisia tabaci]